MVEELQAIETVILSPPKDSPWGRRAVILDPDGHKIELVD
ncbi:MAG: VOC family protein [Cyanobacteria bacterium J06641_2]